MDPNTNIFNDENICDKNDYCYKRINKNLETALLLEEITNIQREVEKENNASLSLQIYSSCNKIIFLNDRDKILVLKKSLSKLHPNFKLDIIKKEELKNKISLEIIKSHCQIYIASNY